MEAHEEQYSFESTNSSANIKSLHNNMIEDAREGTCYAKQQEDRQSTFSPNSEANEQLHMAEFQRAIDRLRLRRQSSTSNQGSQTQEGNRKDSVIRDLLQGQKFRTTTNFSSTCTSPISSNGEYLIL